MLFGTQALCITPSTVKLSLTSFGIVTCVEPLKAAGFPAPAPIAGGGILKSLIGPSSKPPFIIKNKNYIIQENLVLKKKKTKMFQIIPNCITHNLLVLIILSLFIVLY